MKTTDKKLVIKNATSLIEGKEQGLLVVMREHKKGIYLTTVGQCSPVSVAMMLEDIVNKTPQALDILIHMKMEKMLNRLGKEKVAPKKKK